MACRISSKMKAKRTVKSIDEKSIDKTEEECDTSILNKPLTTSINNLSKILKLFHNATEEIREYLTYECDILYECRVCRNIFRSLSNFILHKRSFCREKFSSCHSKWPKYDDEFLDIIQKEFTETPEKTEQEEVKSYKKSLNSIIEGLTQKQKFGFEVENVSVDDIYKQNKDSLESDNSNKKLDLEIIPGTTAGVFQTLKSGVDSRNKTEEMKLEVMEIHHLTEGQSVVLGPDGKIVNIKQKPISTLNESLNLTCKKCNISFATRKTLISHLKYKHESSRLVYPCLECSDTFATVWSVYRHLYNIHKKTLPEVRKMRTHIQAKAFKREEVSEKNKEKSKESTKSLNDQQKIDEENQAWMDNFESDNDIQMCGGCGRRFERKAALNSHSQTCQKRIAARNIITLNKQKRIAATEEKSLDKRNAKIVKLDLESDKKIFDKQKFNVAKKRKIGIQIRYDYNKAVEKNVKESLLAPNTSENIGDDKNISKNNLTQQSSNNVTPTSEAVYSAIGNDKQKLFENSEGEIMEPEVVSIASSNSSPSKEEQDPLSLKDIQSDTDSEIEEILGPIDNMFDENNPLSEIFETKDCMASDSDDQYKISTINESTLKLIKLINSDITEENTKPSLDYKMSSFVNLKKIQCIPCDLKFANISKLRTHMSSHFNWMRFRCDICSFNAYDKADVFEHIKHVHNIQDCEKIEAVILQIPDWETVELSTTTFIPNLNTSSTSEEEKKDELPENITLDSCVIIETTDKCKSNSVKPRTRNTKKSVKIVKIKKKNETNEKNDGRLKDPLADNKTDNTTHSDNDVSTASRSSSRCTDSGNSQDIALKKMVYEVIFGQDAAVSKTTNSSYSSEEKDSVHVVPSDVSNVISRPVRNRVKPLNKDFIYDLHDFKEQPKTVLHSNNSRSFIQSVNNISESLEDLHSSKKSNQKRTNKSEKKSSKNSFAKNDNTIETLNLQKSSIVNFDSSHNQAPKGDEDFSRGSVTVVDPKIFLNHSDEDDDDDIYIIENEELVAVKF